MTNSTNAVGSNMSDLWLFRQIFKVLASPTYCLLHKDFWFAISSLRFLVCLKVIIKWFTNILDKSLLTFKIASVYSFYFRCLEVLCCMILIVVCGTPFHFDGSL